MIDDQEIVELEKEVGETVDTEDVSSEFTPSQESMEEVALQALGRMTLQEIIEDATQALVEVYKARPQSYAYDAAHYHDEDVTRTTPFMDLIQYLIDSRNAPS